MPLPKGALISPKKVRELREAKELTQVGLATLAGVSEATIGRIESNGPVRVHRGNIDSIARVLGTTREALRPDTGEMADIVGTIQGGDSKSPFPVPSGRAARRAAKPDGGAPGEAKEGDQR